ncbi:MAG: hypothetical protein Kow0096_22360 [Thiohalomonadaceae bacterium]
MARHDSASGRNFGWGSKMAYAGHNALRTAHGGGHHGTVAAHSERWGQFANWAKGQGVKDSRQVDQTLVERYAADLSQRVAAGEVNVAYAQNLLSSVNTTLAALREDSTISVRPSVVGTRSTVRSDAPGGIDRAAIGRAADALRTAGHERAAAIVELTRDLGLRQKEAALLDARGALEQARRTGKINVTEGTKGGRGHEIDRLVPVSEQAMATLQGATAVQGAGRNLIPEGMSWVQFSQHVKGVALPALREEGLGTVHDQRAAYACERYMEITGHQAPVVSGRRYASKETDRNARETISKELGHKRIEVVAEYVGSSR